MSFNWKQLLSTVAPLVGTAIGGPFGGLAAKAISMAVLGKPDATPDEVSAAVQANPDLVLKLKEAELAFKETMAQLGIKEEQLAQQDTAMADADRASARAMQMSNKDWMVDVLAGLYTIGYFVALWFFGTHPLDGSTKGLVQTLLGVLSSAEVSILSFYFGASRGGNTMMAKVLDAKSG